MSNFNINNVTFHGDGNHIGDKYDSPQTYLKIQKISSKEGIELVNTIFNFNEKDNQEDFLEAVKSVEINPENITDKQKSYLRKLFEKLYEKGLDKAMDAFYNLLSNFKPELILVIAESSDSFAEYISKLN